MTSADRRAISNSPRIGRGTSCSDRNLGRITNFIHLHDPVDLILTDAGRCIRVGDNFLRQHDDILGEMGIHHGIAQRTAARATGKAVGVAIGIASRDADEGDVDGDFSRLNEGTATTMGMHGNRLLHQTMRNGIGQLAAHAGSVDLPDHAILDMINERRIGGDQRGRCQCQILEAHIGEDLHHHIDDLIALAIGMMEGNGHSVLEANAAHSFLHRIDQLAIKLRDRIGQIRNFRCKALKQFWFCHRLAPPRSRLIVLVHCRPPYRLTPEA